MDREKVGDVHDSGGEVGWKRRRNTIVLRTQEKVD
jgi:hypothetical protein